MSRSQTLFVTTFAAAMALTAAAHAQPSAPASATVADSDPTKACNLAKAKHDHGAERGTPSAKAMAAAACARAAGTSSAAEAASTPKKRLNHDHGKFHKNS